MPEITVIIKHKWFAKAWKRGEYLEKEKKRDAKGRAAYVLSGDGERVGRLWGKLPFNLPVKKAAIAGQMLMLGSNCAGRNEVIEFLVSASPDSDRTEAAAAVDAVVDALFSRHFPGRPYLACRHQDVAHVHAHVLTVNDNGHGKSVQISDAKFLEIRRDIAKWCKVRVKSAWCQGRKIERRLASLTKAQAI